MTPRQPIQPRPGPKPALVASGRGNSPLLQLVQSRMAADELWNFKSSNDLWICPFCLSGIAKRPGLTLIDSIARHLENCRHFALGKGQVQSKEQISAKRSYESMVHAAQTDPAWRVYETDGVWISPFSLQRIPSVKAPGGKLDNFLFQALAKHLAQCPFHRQGIAHTVDEVMLARELHRRIGDVARFTMFQLHTQASWRHVNAQGSWICPYTLFAVPQVHLGSLTEWAQAPQVIALHLITHCPRFATGQAVPHPDETIANTAGPDGRSLPAPQTAVPTPVSPTQILGTTTRSGLAILTPTPTSLPAIGSGASPVLVPRISTPVPTGKPPAGQSGGFLFSRTPLPTNPDVSALTRRVTPLPRMLTPPPAPPLPVAEPIPVAAPPPAAAKSTNADGEDDDHLGWMDDADSSGHQVIPEAAPRTDMIHARRLQETLLQQAPAMEGFQFACRYEACSDITGDFYVFIQLPDNKVGIALGDVSGHGVQAGLVMSMARKTLEIYAGQGFGPADTLSRVNNALVADLGGKMFVSMIYGVLDPAEATITWARAGHNPVLRYNVISEESTEVKPKGMVVGMKAGPLFRASIDEEVSQLEAGDVFLLYTDGITETMNLQQEEFGPERLNEVLRQFASDGPETLVDQIMGRMRHFRGPQPASDDATMVALLVE